ncbi:MAG TPA: poly-gamma-glutamate biosynthesis protein PgsC/CapC, partial [Candidatus Competibacter sp.]|nr:poly-gamma-glutamate biosynthesis protein PgsC/CapC [Candidatus Competibacter sp.]
MTVAVFFTLRFGWNLSGLVVPGYMTPLLLVKPLSAAVVFTEGVITYLLVHGFSERCSRYGVWSSLFGRDRFFGLVLVSVAVRLVGDGWLWPAVGELWSDYFHTDFDYRGELHSFGLIVVSLIANQFWKTGVRGGWIPVFATVGLTYLIVRYGLMEFTNFSIANLSYAYNDLAASLLAAPKAYIVLLTTAFLASRMNLYYGWEFNGILIPSLLALQWYQPTKILTSFLEAFLVLGMARLLFRIPAVAGLHLEGPRQLLFFFNLGYGYKLALGWLLPLVWPTAPVGDAYGFGYLLTTLIAMRMHDKEIIARLTRATLQTSLVAVGVASVVGFALALLSEHRPWLEQPAVGTGAIVRSASRSLSELLNDASVRLRRFCVPP